jgi:hypothetical protein
MVAFARTPSDLPPCAGRRLEGIHGFEITPLGARGTHVIHGVARERLLRGRFVTRHPDELIEDSGSRRRSRRLWQRLAAVSPVEHYQRRSRRALPVVILERAGPPVYARGSPPTLRPAFAA